MKVRLALRLGAVLVVAVAGVWLWLRFASRGAAENPLGSLISDAEHRGAALAGPAAASGVVVDAKGPIAGAHVRVRATDNLTFTASNGAFTLTGLESGLGVEIAAWAEGGYYIASQVITPPVTGVTLTLRPYHSTDNPDYTWLDPSPNPSATLQCGNCHTPIMPQWEANAHGGAISNPRFFSLYNGTDLAGSAAVSPGFQLDFPGLAGSCAACHAPGAAANAPFSTNMNTVLGNVTAGIHCDYCHKIGGVYLDPATHAPYQNAPGALSTRLLRPPPGEQIFFGPYDDVKDPDTFLPEMSQSVYCAPCHTFSFWGTAIYQSYNEWLASPYAAAGVQCQSCHMPPNGENYFVPPERGGLWHPAEDIPSHLDLGLRDTTLMQNTIAMTLTAQTSPGAVVASVQLVNTGAGHHVPTDHPGRHLLLVIEAKDGQGHELARLAGAVVPAWGGAQAGLPGQAFAKVLQDAATGEYPVVSYWKQTHIKSDNRIPALGSDRSAYTFAAPSPGGQVTVTAKLLLRRSFQADMEARGWNEADILMEEATTMLVTEPGWITYLPAVAR